MDSSGKMSEVESDPQAADRRVSLSSVATLGPVVAPLTLALTGMLYLSGWSHREASLSWFGLQSSLFQEPIQSTLARGFMPLVAGAILLAAICGLGWLALNVAERSVEKPKRVAPDPLQHENPSSFAIFRRWMNRFASAYFVLTLGLVSGAVSGLVEMAMLTAAVDKGCVTTCFRYRIEGRDYVGRLVVQDGQRTAIYAQDRLHLFESAKMTGVAPQRPADKR